MTKKRTQKNEQINKHENDSNKQKRAHIKHTCIHTSHKNSNKTKTEKERRREKQNKQNFVM